MASNCRRPDVSYKLSLVMLSYYTWVHNIFPIKVNKLVGEIRCCWWIQSGLSTHDQLPDNDMVGWQTDSGVQNSLIVTPNKTTGLHLHWITIIINERKPSCYMVYKKTLKSDTFLLSQLQCNHSFTSSPGEISWMNRNSLKCGISFINHIEGLPLIRTAYRSHADYALKLRYHPQPPNFFLLLG